MQDVLRCPAKSIVIDRENAHCAFYLAQVPPGHQIEDVMRPTYFGLVQNGRTGLRVGDIISVRPETYEWHLELMVRAVDPVLSVVTTSELWRKVFGEPALPPGWAIEYRGAEARHVILYEGEVKEGGFVTPEAAANRISVVSGHVERPMAKRSRAA